MSDTNAASEGSLTMEEAVSVYEAPEEEIAESAAPETVERPEAEELASEDADAAPQDEPSGEDEDQSEADPEDDIPSIEPPRSWTKEDKELFKTHPGASQERLLEIDRARELEVRRGQNENAERERTHREALQRLEAERQRYEAALPSLFQQFQNDFHTKFQDIKTWDDVAKMRNEDPLRFMEWQTEREKGQQLQAQAEQAQTRQQQEWQSQFQAWTQQEDQRFAEIAPEFFDPKTAPQFQQQAVDLLESVGITRDEIRASWEGRASFSIRDHRFQTIIRDAMKYRSAKSAVKTAPAKPTPPVQRPGAAPQRGDSKKAQNADAMKRLSKTGSIHDALKVDF